MNFHTRVVVLAVLAVSTCTLGVLAEQQPPAPDLSLDESLGQCPGLPAEETIAPLPAAASAFCQASCSPYASVSCSGSTCSAADRNCSLGQRGYVQCDGSYTYCPLCPVAQCSSGTEEWVNWGCCCGAPVAKQYHRKRVCVGGTWQYTNTYSCYGSCSDPNGCDPLEP